MSLNSTLGRLRLIGALEGTSFLVLLLVAMPLKYLAGQPQAVTVVGGAHGLLWILYLLALIHAAVQYKWPLGRLFAGFVASVLPLGPFIFDAKVVREQEGQARA